MKASPTLRATQGILIRRIASSRGARSAHLSPVPCGWPVQRVSRCRASLGRVSGGGVTTSVRFCVQDAGAWRARFRMLQTTQRPRKPGGSPPTQRPPRVLRVASSPPDLRSHPFQKERARRTGFGTTLFPKLPYRCSARDVVQPSPYTCFPRLTFVFLCKLVERSQHDSALRRASWRRGEGESELGAFDVRDCNKFNRHLLCSHAPEGHVSNEIMSRRPQLPPTDVKERRLVAKGRQGGKISPTCIKALCS